MQYRTLGTPELNVSAIGFGGWPMGGSNYGAVDDDGAANAIHAALDAGINLFDTAAGYGLGHSEQVLGTALGARRADVIVVTKTGLSWEPTSDAEPRHRRTSLGGPGQYVRDSRPATIRAQCDESLANLGTDYLDIYLIHWPDFETPIEDTMRALETLVAEGKVRHLGVSNFTTDLLDAARAVHPLVTNQIGYHMLDRRKEDEIIPYCRANGIGIMAYGSLAHGMLAGAFTPSTTLDADDWRASGYAFGLPLFHADHLALNLTAVSRIRALAEGAGLSLPQLALAWVLREPTVSTALVGCRNPAEVAAAVAVTTVDVPAAVLVEADAIAHEAYQRMRRDELSVTDVGPVRRKAG